MSRDRRVLRLLEGLCAVIALLYGTLLVLFTNYGALQVSYENGDLNSTIVVFAGACVGWVGLRLVRSPDAAQLGWSSVVHAPLAWWA